MNCHRQHSRYSWKPRVSVALCPNLAPLIYRWSNDKHSLSTAFAGTLLDSSELDGHNIILGPNTPILHLFVETSIINWCEVFLKEAEFMDHMTPKEASNRWGISERQIQLLCTQKGDYWRDEVWPSVAMPKEAKKPLGGRRKPVPGEEFTNS